MKKQKDLTRIGTGLAEHASTAAFTTSRAVTSHVRNRYRTRYRGRYRYASALFAFDLALLGLATFLVGMNVYLFTVIPAPLEGYRLDLVTPSIRSAAPIALEARVTATGDDAKRDVRLVWELPPGTEILQAEPPIAPDGAYLGTIQAGETRSSRIVARLFVPQGDATFRFRLSDADGEIAGVADRRVVGSGLRFEPLIPLAAAWRDAPIPYRVRNDTTLPLEGVTVRAAAPSSINGLTEVRIARIEPFEERVFVVRPSVSSAIELAVETRGADVVRRPEAYAILQADPVGARLELAPSGGNELSFRVFADRAASLAIWHPGLPDEGRLRIMEIEPGEREIRLPVETNARETSWYVIPFVTRPDGNAIGAGAIGALTTPFAVHASARYFAVSGDQIGVGPLPPRVGEPTKVWIGLKLAPTTSELSDLRVRVRLAPGVRVTGRDALPDGGSFSQTEAELVWNAGVVSADPDGRSAFFEVELTPTAADRGRVPVLIEAVRADALDLRLGERRETSFGAVDMNLSEDEFGKNLGRVE